MNDISVDEAITPGYQPPVNVQFSVFLDNRVGRLLELMEIFENRQLAVAGFSVVDASDHAVVRLLTSNQLLAARLLQRHGLPYSESEVLVVEVTARRGMVQICRELRIAEVNVHYAYPLLVQPRGNPAVVLDTDDLILTGQILRRKLYYLLAENDLGENAPGSDPACDEAIDPDDE
jgi:hypothetical protein